MELPRKSLSLARLEPARWRRISELADQALELPDERVSLFLDQACAGDLRLRQEIEELLRADRSGECFLETANLDAWLLESLDDEESDGAGPRPEPLEGRRIGAWRIVREIGRGGMGAVYLAERADGGFEQRVALKLVKRGLDTDEILQRFLRERRILARLEHKHIARLIDGGVTDDGLPWFAMEHVEGQPITTWCEAVGAGIPARLQLFRSVCEAVQYAHRSLVVHRDLKPSNIFVTTSGEVKLLDFGIARLLSPEDFEGEQTLTQTGLRILTPQYAAPEQIRGEAATTATDLYSLGVVLYELLAGTRPCGRAEATLEEMQRAVLEEEPAPPSEVRSAWRRELRGDLDHITLMALRKEPERRYPSVDALLADLERHREGAPVRAAVSGPLYRLGKIVRRHRPAVLAAALVTAAALAGMVVALWQTVAAALLVASLTGGLAIALWQTRTARREARKAEEVRKFLVSVFEVSDPSHARGQSITARELLDRGAARIESELRGEPEVRAEIMGVLGDLYVKLGLIEPGLRVVERELELLGSFSRSRPRDRAAALRRRGDLLLLKGDWTGAEGALREAADLHRAAFGATSPEYAEDMDQLASVLHLRGRHKDAELLQRRSLEIRRQVFGKDHPAVAHALNNLAIMAREGGRLEEAEGLYRDCLRIRRAKLPPDHPDFCATLINLTALLIQMGRYDEAERAAQEALALHLKLYGEEHVLTVGAVNTLGAVMVNLARWEQAEALFRKALRYWEGSGGGEHPNTIATMNNLARALNERGEVAEAEVLQRRAVERWQTLLGDRHPVYATGLMNLAAVLRTKGALDEADAVLARALDIQRETHGEDHPEVANVLFHRAGVAERRGDLEEAERWFRQASAMRDRHLGTSSHGAALCRSRLATVLRRRGRIDEAKMLAREALQSLRSTLPAGHPDLSAAEAEASAMEPLADQRSH